MIGLVIVQATPFCNLDCDYCYLPHRSDTAKISLSTVRRIFTRLRDSEHLGDDVSVVWHAGEPTVVPPPVFADFMAAADDAVGGRTRLQHNIQTNATLIDDRWCDLLREYRVRVGVSLDGPRDVHDRHRRYRDGRGSFDKTIAGLRRLVGADLDPGVITVVTADLLPRAVELHQLLIDEGVTRLGLNVEEIEGVHRTSTLLRPDQEIAWRGFIRTLYRLSRRSGLRVREFDAMVAALTSRGSVRDDQSEPFAILSFDAAGTVSTFSPELLTVERPAGSRPFVFGNVWDGPIDRIADDVRFRAAAAAITRGNAMCRSECGYFTVCGGGAPANKMAERGRFDITQTRYCRFRRQLLAEELLDELLRETSELDAPVPAL